MYNFWKFFNFFIFEILLLQIAIFCDLARQLWFYIYCGCIQVKLILCYIVRWDRDWKYSWRTDSWVGRTVSIQAILEMLILLTRSNDSNLHVITARKLGNSQVFWEKVFQATFKISTFLTYECKEISTFCK